MKKDDCYYLGRITKAHGIKGQVQCYFDVNDQMEYEGLDAFFVELNNGLMPLFIEDINLKKPGKVIVTLEDHEHVDDVDYLISKALYLPLATLPKLEDDQFYYHEIKGFMVVDKEEGEVGLITDVLEYSSQPLIQVDFNGNELLFPISDEVIKEVDKENKIMKVELTEGLLDIYR